MKVERKSKRFSPITIEITMETQEEAQHLYAVFNYTPVCSYLRSGGVEPGDIREAIGDELDSHETLELKRLCIADQ